MSEILLPKSSADSFMTLLVYSDKGSVIVIEGITEIQSYVGSTDPQDPRKLFRESKLSLRPGHASFGAEILPGTLMVEMGASIDSLPKDVVTVSQDDKTWGILTHLGGVITMIENICELHTPTVNTQFPNDALFDNTFSAETLYTWVWFNYWSRFLDRWQDLLVDRGYIEESFIELMSALVPENKELTETCVLYMRNKMCTLLRDNSKTDPQIQILKAAARRPYAYTTLDMLQTRDNIKPLITDAVNTEQEEASEVLKTFEEFEEIYDYEMPK